MDVALKQVMHRRALLALAFGSCVVGCSPKGTADQCKALSPAQATQLAIEQKRHMLARSTISERANFASDASELGTDLNGYVAKVLFKGKDGKTLVALIEADCYVGWTGD